MSLSGKTVMHCHRLGLTRMCPWITLAAFGCSAAPPSGSLASAGAGAGTPTTAASQPAVTTRPGSAIAPGKNYDPARAFLKLTEIQPPVTQPVAPTSTRALKSKPPPQAVRRLVAGRKLFNEQRYAEAILELEQALRYDPNSPEIHALLALACQESGNESRAAVHVEKTLKANPDDVVGHYLIGANELALRHETEAIRHLRTALLCSNARPDNPYAVLARYRLAGALHSAGYLTAAIEQFEAFESLARQPAPSLLENAQLARILQVNKGLPAQRIAEAYLTLGDTAKAADALGRASRDKPSDPKLRIRHGKTLIRAQRYDDAIEVARELIREFPEVTEGTDLLVQAYEASGRVDAALADLQALAAEQSDNVPLTLTLADTLSRRGRRDQAVKVLNELIERQPEELDAYWKLASILSDEGTIDAVVDIAARAVRATEHGHADAAAHIRQLPGQHGAAVKDYLRGEDLLRRAEKDYAYGYVLGTLAEAANEPAQAEKALRASVTARKDFLPAYLALGNLYLNRYAWDQAIETAQAATATGKKLPAIERLIGQGHDGLDRHDQAVEHYNAALRLHPRDTTTLWLLGQLHARTTGEANKAQQRLLELLRIEPAHNRARQALFELYLARQETENAQRQLEGLRSGQGSPVMAGRCEALLALRAGRLTPKGYREKLTRLLKEHGEDTSIRIELARSYWLKHDLDAVLEQIDQARKLGPLSTAGLELLAVTHQQRLDFEACESVYRSMLARHPNRISWVEGHYHLERIRQRYDKATTILQELLAGGAEPGRPNRIRRWLILTLQRREQHAEAVAQARKWYEAEPSNATLRNLLTQTLQAAGKRDEAIALARTWYEADPTDVGARMILLNALSDAKRIVEAQQLLLDWLADDPDNKQVVDWLYVVLRTADRHHDAIEWLLNAQQAAASAPGGRQRGIAGNLNLQLPIAYGAAKRYDEAIKLYRRMLRRQALPPNVKLDLDIRLVNMYMAAKQYDDAENHLVALLKDIPENQTSVRARLRRQLAFVYQQVGRDEAAEREMLAVLEDLPNDIGVSNDLGYSWSDKGKNLARAEQMIRFAVGQRPDEMAYLDSLGWVLYKKGASAEAKRWLTRAVNALDVGRSDPLGQPPDPIVMDHLGDALWRLGEKDAAVERWGEAVKLFKTRAEDASPDETEARQRTEQKLESVGNNQPPPVADVVDAGGNPGNEGKKN